MARGRSGHVLIATDGSPGAAAACRAGAVLARLVGARVTLLHVAVPAPLASADRSPARALQAEAAARAAGELILGEAAAQVAGVGSSIACARELRFGDPAATICQRAGELGADLVVVGNRGAGLLDRLVAGSVSTAVSQHAPCSVLLVRQPPSS